MLELRDLRRRFGGTVALDGLSLSVRPGRLHGFVGANGAGKTTAMRVVVGVERVDSGEVLLDGAPVSAEARRRIGYMPEERGLYPKMRARDQLVYLARLRGATKAAAREAATSWLERLGLGSRVDDPVEDLSLGNQQRVQLAAALVSQPDLLVLDEPFSGLDPVATDVMAEVLVEQAARGVPVLFSSHQLELVERLCETVTIVAAGRLVADGAVRDLRREGAPRRLAVSVPAPDGSAAWARGVPGCRVVGEDDDGVVLELDDGTDDQAVLRAAQSAGPVHRFAPVVPTLAERYRTVTTAPPDQAPA